MKANEFVKKYGIAEAKALVKAQSWTMRQMALSTTVDTKELTKLVESHELVKEHGGLGEAKLFISDYSNDASEIYDLKQAITDVESCHVD